MTTVEKLKYYIEISINYAINNGLELEKEEGKSAESK
jgi:hypothetical protein